MKILFNLGEPSYAVYKIFQHGKKIAYRRPLSTIEDIKIDTDEPVKVELNYGNDLEIPHLTNHSMIVISWNKTMSFLRAATSLSFMFLMLFLLFHIDRGAPDYWLNHVIGLAIGFLFPVIFGFMHLFYFYSKKSAYIITHLTKE